MKLERDEAGDLWLREMSPLHADTLLHVPEWLESQDPRVRARLLPQVYDELDGEEHWRKYAVPELEHLFASRAELLAQDLKALARDGKVTYCLRIPRAHAAAWLSSLNAARLALFELHDLKPEHLEGDPADVGDPDQEIVLVRIHVMAFTQELLLDEGV